MPTLFENNPTLTKERRARRWTLWLLAGLVIVLVTVIAALQLFVWELVEPENPLDAVTLFSLSSLLFLSFFIFTFILLRNLIKLQRERSRHTLGSKLKTRLVVLLISLSLLPVTAMSLFSYTFLNRSLEKWFGRLPEQVVAEAHAVQQHQQRTIASEVRRANHLIAANLEANQAVTTYLTLTETVRADDPDRQRATSNASLTQASASVATALENLRRTSDVVAIELTHQNGERLLSVQQPTAANGNVNLEALAARSRLQPENLVTEEYRGDLYVTDGTIDDAASNTINAPPGFNFYAYTAPLANGQGFVTLIDKRPFDVSLARILAGAENYERLREQQRRVRFVGLATLSLVTLLMLVATVWTALYLARGIATPITALAEAAQEVARGNLAHRVNTAATDEIAVLANSFNRMVEQLQENRARLELAAAELQSKNFALDERRAYIETVLASLSTGVISLDEHTHVTTINNAALKILRVPAETAHAAQRIELSSIVRGQNYLALEKVITRARTQGRAIEQTVLQLSSSAVVAKNAVANDDGADKSLTARDFAEVPVSLMATALRHASPDSDGLSPEADAHGVVLVIEDLSELLAAQRIAAWSEVARRLAHEIKNPLTPIQLSAERIRRNFQKTFGTHRATVANTNADIGSHINPHTEVSDVPLNNLARTIEDGTSAIVREVTALKTMVDEFSRFARLPEPTLAPADLNDIITHTHALYAERAAGIRFDVQLTGDLPLVLLDAEQMRRVFINLFENAMEAVAGVEPARITVATAYDARRAVVLAEVTDNGEGATDYDKLFQPYFSTRERGTGLGLAIVQRIVTEHGGTIRASANHPRGARFRIELPSEETPRRSMKNNIAPAVKPPAVPDAMNGHENFVGFLTDPRVVD